MSHDLVRLINMFAKSDTTEPPCWRLDVLLGAVEKLVMHTDGNYRRFAGICQEALEGVPDPCNCAIIRLGVLNGLRRPDDTDVDEVEKLFAAVADEIFVLPDGPKKDRCGSFWRYQAKVFLWRNGFYKQAAKAALEEAALAANPAEQAVANYLARTYAVWDAIVGGDSNAIVLAVSALREDLPRLQENVAGTNLDIQWGHGNGPIHLLQALLFTGDMDALDWEPLLETLSDKAKRLGDAFKPWIDVLQAAKKKDKVVLISVATENRSADTTAAARLVLARLLRNEGEIAAAKVNYGRVQPAPNAHMIAAIARREEAALPEEA